MSAARTEPLQVRCPILRGDRLGWIDGDDKLIEDAIAVETTALHVIVYIERTMHMRANAAIACNPPMEPLP